MAALGLCCCSQAFLSCSKWGLFFGAWALGTWASAAVVGGLSSCASWALECRFSSCGAQVS